MSANQFDSNQYHVTYSCFRESLYRKVSREVQRRRSSYLEQPVAPTVEGGDDGGVDVTAIQTLQTGEKRGQKEDIIIQHSAQNSLNSPLIMTGVTF